jgi:hypothetical protein
VAQRMTEYLAIDGGRVQCTRCSADICAADQNYKLWVLQERSSVTEIPGVGDPSVYALTEELELRRYYCPGCCVQLEAEISDRSSEPLWDVELRTDGERR